VNGPIPILYLVTAGETAWSLTGQHMGAVDLPLTERGERNALRLKERLRGLAFVKVLTGPLHCVVKTCELAGFGRISEVDTDLADWNCGEYVGLNDFEILKRRPNWELFRDGCPGGESPAEVAARANRVIERLRRIRSNVLVFSSIDFLRLLATCWVGVAEPCLSSRLMLGAASVSGLGYQRGYSHPVIWFWNDSHHVGA
jgi:probable phosphoglycerate mutase